MGAESAAKLIHHPPPVPIDSVADASVQLRRWRDDSELRCDRCDALIEGEPGGRATYVSTRGASEVHVEEQALCRDCAAQIGVSSLIAYMAREEEG